MKKCDFRRQKTPRKKSKARQRRQNRKKEEGPELQKNTTDKKEKGLREEKERKQHGKIHRTKNARKIAIIV